MATQGEVIFQAINSAGNVSIFESPIRNWTLPLTSGAWPAAAYKLVSAQYTVDHVLMNNVRRDAKAVLDNSKSQQIDSFMPYLLAYAEGSYYSLTRSFTPPESLKGASSISLGFYSTQGDSPDNTGNAFSVRSGCVITVKLTYEILQSEFVLSSTMVNAGSTIRANISAGSTAYDHKLLWKFGTRSVTQDVAAGVTFADWMPPLEWLDQIPNAVTGLASCQLETYHNGVKLGTSAIQYFTVGAPTTVVPNVISLTATRVDNTVSSTWNVYVQNISGVNIEAVGTGAYGSTISSWLIQGDGKTAQAANMSIAISGSGDITFKATATDSRGRTAQKAVTITVLPYSAPVIQNIAVVRCAPSGTLDTSGVHALVSVTANTASVGGKNSGLLTLDYRLKGTEPWTNMVSGIALPADDQIVGGALSVTLAYEIQATVTDAFNSVVQVIPLGTATCFVDRMPGRRRLGIGGYCDTDDTLYVASQMGVKLGTPLCVESGGTGAGTAADARNALGVTAAIDTAVAAAITASLGSAVAEAVLASHPTGCILFNTSGVNPSSYIGGTWVAWGSGRVPVGVNWGDGNFNGIEKTGGASTHTLTNAQIPSQSGSFQLHNAATATNIHTVSGVFSTTINNTSRFFNQGSGTSGSASIGNVHFNNGGGGGAHNNLQPYITCFMFKRTA